VSVIQIIELLGYLASVLVAVSLMMSGIVKLRVINLIGAIFFTIYGLVIHAYPVAFVNGIICFVNIYYLYDIFKTKEYFRILEVMHDAEYLNYFLKFHGDEIKKYMPMFNFNLTENTTAFFILRNSIPAGLICGEKTGNDSLFINLDFVIPGYRDLKIAKYVYTNIFSIKKAQKLYSNPGNAKHDQYLQKMGFEKTVFNGKEIFCLSEGK
jgi:hypothetical protein